MPAKSSCFTEVLYFVIETWLCTLPTSELLSHILFLLVCENIILILTINKRRVNIFNNSSNFKFKSDKHRCSTVNNDYFCSITDRNVL